ncbi:NADP-dependent oxidoreductase [Sphingomonas oryzagri]
MIHRHWRLIEHPEGTRFDAALRLEEARPPDLQDGEVLVRNRWLSLDAGTRMWMTRRTDGYQPPLPLGIVVPGQVMGEVAASRHPGFREGDWVRGFGQWADHSCVRPETSGLTALDSAIDDIRQHLGVLGMNGWTAYVGVVEVGRARAGETVLVSAAAGSTGLLAVQIARNLGCRTAGIAGGAEKCRYLTGTIGAEVAIDRRSDDVPARLASLGGVNVYFDNVGGPLLDAVLPEMAHYGRIALCGLIADYEEAGTVVRRFDQILMRRLQVTGFFSPDFAHRGAELTATLRGWYDEGRLAMPFDETVGLENTLAAYARLFTGGNLGKVIVRL